MLQNLLKKSVSLVPWQCRGMIKRLPLIAPLQRWMLSSFLEGREFVHTVDAGPARGLKYPITLPDDKGIWTGTYESDLAGAIALATKRGDVCFDCGAWRGFFSGVMALAGASRVFAFEPLPANAAQLKKMMQLNPQLPITLIEAAVTDQPGTLGFVVMPATSMGKVATSSFQEEHQSGQKISVRAVTLDSLLATKEVQPPAVMKIDVEGAELMLLRGARDLLVTYKPKLFMEIHSRDLERDCGALLEELGYNVQVVREANRGDVCHFHAIAPN